MTVAATTQDLDSLTLTFTCEFDATAEQVWRMWADPRLLERWWGPPGFPASVTEHDLAVGGLVRYAMTGPDGESYPGAFRFTTVQAPTLLVFEDHFTDADGRPDPAMPVSTTRVEITHAGVGTTRMVLTSTVPTREALEQQIQMGAVEGMAQALGQIDDLLRVPSA